jgi:hypothetical protein
VEFVYHILVIRQKVKKNMPAGPAGRGITYVRLFKNSAISWQLNKLSIVLSAQVFHVKI